MVNETVYRTRPTDWARAFSLNKQWHQQYPVMSRTDVDTRRGERLPNFIYRELLEALAEHDLEGTTGYNFEAHAKELVDVLVFLYASSEVNEVEPDFHQAWGRANGQGSKSDIYDRSLNLAPNLYEGNVQKNTDEFLSLLISLAHHLPQPLKVVKYMDKVIVKNTSNRPVNHYTDLDEQGRPLPDELAFQKYAHNETLLRKLRDHYGSPLQPWMYEPHADLFADFVRTEACLVLLEERIKEQDAFMAEMLYLHLTGHQVRPMPTKVLDKKLQVAGGVLVSA
jgi:hypothetical protein